jgi:hypothetical protein
MFTTRHRVGTRPHLPTHFHVWRVPLLFAMLMSLASWQSASAQTGTLPPVQMHLPLAYGEAPGVENCPVTSTSLYETTPILGNPRNAANPPVFDPDLNLLVRGYKPTPGVLDLIAINGPTDDDAPQLAHLFRPLRVPAFRGLYQIHDWNWACCPGGKIGEPIAEPEVTLVEMATTIGEPLYPPRRHANITRDYVAMVLYAEKYRITFTYTRDDSPARGYVVHVENLCVDPNLLALYTTMHADGRDQLPALRRGDSIGIAHSPSILIAVRDTGSFMDPRSGRDWWQESVRAMLTAQAADPAHDERAPAP